MAPYRRGAQQRSGFGLLMLAGQIMQIGTDRIPPVTLATVILNVAIFLRLIPTLPSVHGACTSYSNVLQNKEWKRLFLSSFYHLDDMHLYFNMASFIWKGITLENKLKSTRFAIVLIVFSLLSQVVMIILNYCLYEAFSNQQYLYTCAAGFSAVVFALKVLTTRYSDDNVSVMGFPMFVPARYACWVELIVIQILVPNASFTGHLAGILVGLLYTNGPLKTIIKVVYKLISGHWNPFTSSSSYTYVVNESGVNQHDHSRNISGPQNAPHGNDDESLQHAIRESLRDVSYRGNQRQSPTPGYGWNIPEPNAYPNNLYPDISEIDRPEYNYNNSGFSGPSAPPLDSRNDVHETPPYPLDNSFYPYPNTRLQQSSNTEEQVRNEAAPNVSYKTFNEKIMRNARLRKFDKNS